MYAVVLQLIRTEPELLKRIGLITYGSPLQWAYTRGFPAMLSYESHKAVAEQLGGGWRNIIRATDPIGGPVLTWNQTAVVEDGVVRSMTANHLRQDTGNAPEEFTRLKRSSRNPGAHKVGSEYWITDPDLGDPTETTRGHSDYFHDPVWPRVVADIRENLAGGSGFRNQQQGLTMTPRARRNDHRIEPVPKLTSQTQQIACEMSGSTARYRVHVRIRLDM